MTEQACAAPIRMSAQVNSLRTGSLAGGDASRTASGLWWRECVARLEWLARLASRATLYRALGVLVGLGLYVALDWLPLRAFIATTVTSLLHAASVDAMVMRASGSIVIVMKSGLFPITALCTYMDLFLILAPLAWRQRVPWLTNVGRVVFTGLAVSAMNLVRVTGGLMAYDAGATWTVAHTLPDTVLYYPTLIFFIVAAARSDRQPAPG